jgi:ABC-2 type transport system ATP-binding protein
MRDGKPALIAQNLSFRYAGQTDLALSQTGLALRRGYATGLLGPNGSGKSTLIDILAGLKEPQDGRVQFVGEPPPTLALVPQEYAFYPQMTCRENLVFFASMLNIPINEAWRRVDAVVHNCLLDEFLHKRADQCSGGVRRKLNLGIALLSKPDILLLDEPTVGVDPQSRAFLLDVIKRLMAAGCAVLYATHYMEEITALCSDIVLLEHGRVLACGDLDTLLAPQPDGTILKDLGALFVHYTNRTLRD